MSMFNQQFQPYSPVFPQNIQSNLPANPNIMNNSTDTGIIWVQGESGAKAFPVAPGKSAVLFDSESEHFFIKSVDISGMPQPLRVFTFSEATETDLRRPEIDTSVFITREEFQHAIDQINTKYGQHSNNSENFNNRGGRNNGKPLIQSNN